MKATALPLDKIAANLVFGRDGAWAGFHVRCHSYQAESVRRRVALARNLMDYAKQSRADFQIIRVSRRFDSSEYVQKLWGKLPPHAHKVLWHNYLEEQGAILDNLDAWTPEVFIFVRLAEPTVDISSRASSLFEQTPRELRDAAWEKIKGIKGERTTNSQDIEERAQIALSRLHILMDVRPATYQEIQWLIRRSFCRGVAEPDVSPEDANSPEVSHRFWFGENGISPYFRHLKMDVDGGESYQAGLCLGEVGHSQPLSRQVELMFSAIEEYPWPIDLSLNVRYVPNEQAKRNIYNQAAKKAVALEEEEKATSGAMSESHERVVLSRELHARLSNTGEPVLEGSLSMIVSADSEKEMRRRVRIVQDGFPHPLYRPYGNQLDLWRQHLPGQPSLVRGYDRIFTCEQIGAMVPHATHEAGSDTDRAFLLGKTIRGRFPIMFDLTEASQTNKPPTIELIGTLGGGKSILAQYLMYVAWMLGFPIVDIDPKGDHRLHLLEEVRGSARAIILGPNPEHRGRLDPLRTAPEGEQHDSAASFLGEILPEVRSQWSAAISGAITRVRESDKELAACWSVIEALEAGEGCAPEVGQMIREFGGGGIVQLGLAHKEDPLPATHSEQLTYIQIRSLKRAAAGTSRSEMTVAQRHGRAVLGLSSLYGMKVMSGDRSQPKVANFDEASFLQEDSVGRQWMDMLLRWARWENVSVIRATQLNSDTAGQENLVGHRFRFGMRTAEDARQSLRSGGLDENSELVDALTRYEEGECAYTDLKGRTEEMRVMPGADLLRRLTTTPEEQESEVSETFGSSENLVMGRGRTTAMVE